jgi:rubrerythrin
MGQECEHLDGDYVAKCAICGDMACGECFQTLFNTVICGQHEHLEDDSAWELLGFYTSPAALEERRYFMQEQGITSIVVESEDDMTEMYVPIEEKSDAFEALSGAGEDILQCDSCKVFFSKAVGTCPICGVRHVEEEI